MSNTLCRDELWKQLENAISLRSSENSALWQAFSLFLATNGVLLIALFTAGKLPMRDVALIVSGVGIVISILWTLVQRRPLAHIKAYEGLRDTIENKLFEGYDTTYSIKNAVDAVHSWLSARQIMSATTIITLIVWTIAFILSCKLLT